MDRKNTSELIGLAVSMKMAAKANVPRWFGLMLRTEDNRVSTALNFEVRRKRKNGRPKSTLKGKVKESLKNLV